MLSTWSETKGQWPADASALCGRAPVSLPAAALGGQRCVLVGVAAVQSVAGPAVAWLTRLRASDPRIRRWNEHERRYRHLGHGPLPGTHRRYFRHSADGCLPTLLGFGSAASKTALRDRFVGWSPVVRQRNLLRVVNHARFLILVTLAGYALTFTG